MDFQRHLFNKIGSFSYFGVGGSENPQLPKIGVKEHCTELSFPGFKHGGRGGRREKPFFEAHSTF